ncbi:unnamed protein product, partial [Prunus brigantina]
SLSLSLSTRAQPLSLRKIAAVAPPFEPPPPATATHNPATKLTTCGPPSQPSPSPAVNRQQLAEICRNCSSFSKNSNHSFSLISPPNLTSEALPQNEAL